MQVSLRWKQSKTDSCPLCSNCREESFHVWRCQHECIRQLRRTERIKFEKLLSKLETEDTIVAIINAILDYWDSPDKLVERVNNLHFHDNKWRILYDSQAKLGWKNFLLGILSKEFGAWQEDYYRSLNLPSSRSGHVWTRKIMTSLWQMYQTLWKERCRVVNCENQETAEKRYRNLLWDYYQELQQKKWRFSATDCCLLEKSEEFFQKSPYRNIEMWKRQVDLATSTAKFKAHLRNKDIREFVRVTSPSAVVHNVRKKKQPSYKSLIPTQVTYRQLQLEFNTVRRSMHADVNRGKKIQSRKRQREVSFDGEKQYIRKWLGISKGQRKESLHKNYANVQLFQLFFRIRIYLHCRLGHIVLQIVQSTLDTSTLALTLANELLDFCVTKIN